LAGLSLEAAPWASVGALDAWAEGLVTGLGLPDRKGITTIGQGDTQHLYAVREELRRGGELRRGMGLAVFQTGRSAQSVETC